MRVVRLAALAAASIILSPTATSAQSARVGVVGESLSSDGAKQPVSTAPLAANEILLEVAAEGSASAPAERARIQIVLTGRGATVAAARDDLERQRGRLVQAVAAAGIEPSDIGPPREFNPMGFVGNEQAAGWSVTAPPSNEEKLQRQPIEVTVGNLSRLAEVGRSLEGAGFEPAPPTFDVVNERPLLNRARQAALTELRARAEDYAAAAGLRVLRLIRVSERATTADISQTSMRRFMQQMMGGAVPNSREVERVVYLSADFALGTR